MRYYTRSVTPKSATGFGAQLISPIQLHVKRQPSLTISFSQHSAFFEGQSKIQAEIRLGSCLTWGVCWGVCEKIVHTKMHFQHQPDKDQC